MDPADPESAPKVALLQFVAFLPLSVVFQALLGAYLCVGLGHFPMVLRERLVRPHLQVSYQRFVDVFSPVAGGGDYFAIGNPI